MPWRNFNHKIISNLKGHVETDEELETSLAREISEEVGISLKDLKIEKQ